MVSKEIWKSLARIGASSGAQFLSTVEEIPSGPLAFDVSRLRSFLRTFLGRNYTVEMTAVVFECRLGGLFPPSTS